MGLQICRFCWHRIRTDENGLCPACRKAYPENPADFRPLSQEEMAHLKAQKKQKYQQRKQKIIENRKHLANVRVVQHNLVFVVGLPSRLADAEVIEIIFISSSLCHLRKIRLIVLCLCVCVCMFFVYIFTCVYQYY
jgi:hypothetical protein